MEDLTIILDDLVNRLEDLRINVDVETEYNDPTGALRRELERANDMLDECIYEVRSYFKGEEE